MSRREVDLPAWLPPPVRNPVLLVEKLFPENLVDDLAILRRLATDQRMIYVWRELARRKATNEALVEFFDCAFGRARFPYFVTTLKDRIAPWSSAAELCRRSNKYLIANPELAAALVLVADYFEGVARENMDSPLVVKRHSADGPGRAYVRVLGALTRKLFGSPLYRTVATTASVALRGDI
jgi:hypothetical protein